MASVRGLVRVLCVALLTVGADAPAKEFVHPGLLHTAEDLARMRAKVAAAEQPWLAGWERLLASPHAQLGYRPRPSAQLVRGNVPGQNFVVFANDTHAAYQLALRWQVGGDTACADRAVAVLNAWSAQLQQITGNSDRFLAAGLYGYQVANAAELLRDYPGWARADFARFQQLLLTVFYPLNHDFLVNHNTAAITNYWANWDLCNLAAMQAIGVVCDRRDLYDEALAYLRGGRGNGALDKLVYYLHPGQLGQWQESGRDQGHATLGLALAGPLCETAWHQGDDLYGYDNCRLLAGAEYVAKYNLGDDVPYQPYAWGLGQRGERREQPVISALGRPSWRVGYELIVNHYVNRLGLAAPYSQRYAARLRPEGGGGGHASTFDQLGLGTLTATIEPRVAHPRPCGLTARRSGSSVVLSWWGAADATAYRVQRAPAAGGPPVTLAEVTDPTTYSDRDVPPAAWLYTVAGLRDGRETSTSEPVRVSTVTTLRTHLTFAEDAPSLARLVGDARLVPGRGGQAVECGGRDGHVALPPGVVSDLSDFTLAAWVRLAAEQTSARLFDFGDERGRSLYLTPRGAAGGVRFGVTTVYGYDTQTVDGRAPLPTGRWVHVAVTLEGRLATLYVDGVAVGRNPALDFPPYRLGATDRNWLGRSQEPRDPYLRGAIGDFRLYDGALPAAAVAALAGT